MGRLMILNRKKAKMIIDAINSRFCSSLDDSGLAFLQNKDGRVYVVNRELEKLNSHDMRIDSIGLYAGTQTGSLFRPSIEGSQIIGRTADDNIIDLSGEQASDWLRGEDIRLDADGKEDDDARKGVYLVRSGEDFFGSGIIKKGKLLNHVPKSRRINTIWYVDRFMTKLSLLAAQYKNSIHLLGPMGQSFEKIINRQGFVTGWSFNLFYKMMETGWR